MSATQQLQVSISRVEDHEMKHSTEQQNLRLMDEGYTPCLRCNICRCAGFFSKNQNNVFKFWFVVCF